MKKAPKIALIIVAILLIISLGGYTALWFTQARIAKDEVNKLIGLLNADHKILSYESITTRGFPTHVTVRIEKPVATVPIQEIVKPMGQLMPPAPDGTEQADLRKSLLEIPAWIETIALDGHIDIRVNAFSDNYSIIPEGNYNIQSMVNEETKKYSYQVINGARGCDVQFSRPDTNATKIWSWDYLSGDIKQILTTLEKVHCQIPEYQVVLEEGNTPVFTSKASNLLFETQKNGAVKSYSVNIALPEYTATNAFDELAEYYYHTIYPNRPLPSKYKMAALGKQSFKLDVFASANDAAPNTAPIIFNVKDFTYASDIGETKMTIDFNAKPEGEAGKATWNIHMSSNSNEKGYAKYLEDAKDLAQEIYDNSTTQGVQVPFSREEFASQFQTLVPKVHELGTFNFNFSGNGDVNAEKQINFIMDVLELTFSPYGVSATGKGQMASPLSPMPQGEFNITCRNCTVLVDDLSGWVAKLLPLFAATPEAQSLTHIKVDQPIIDGIKDFMKTLDPNATDDFNFAIVIDGKSEPSINSKPLTEVLALYQDKVGKLLQADNTLMPPTASAAPTTPVEQIPVATTPPSTEMNAKPAEIPAEVQATEPAPVELHKQPEPAAAIESKKQSPVADAKSADTPTTPIDQAVNSKPKESKPQVKKAAKPVKKAPAIAAPAPSAEQVLPGQSAIQ